MCGFVLYDTQLIIEKRRHGDKDFISHSVDLFVDLLGIFRRLVIILIQKVSSHFSMIAYEKCKYATSSVLVSILT